MSFHTVYQEIRRLFYEFLEPLVKGDQCPSLDDYTFSNIEAKGRRLVEAAGNNADMLKDISSLVSDLRKSIQKVPRAKEDERRILQNALTKLEVTVGSLKSYSKKYNVRIGEDALTLTDASVKGRCVRKIITGDETIRARMLTTCLDLITDCDEIKTMRALLHAWYYLVSISDTYDAFLDQLKARLALKHPHLYLNMVQVMLTIQKAKLQGDLKVFEAKHQEALAIILGLDMQRKAVSQHFADIAWNRISTEPKSPLGNYKVNLVDKTGNAKIVSFSFSMYCINMSANQTFLERSAIITELMFLLYQVENGVQVPEWFIQVLFMTLASQLDNSGISYETLSTLFELIKGTLPSMAEQDFSLLFSAGGFKQFYNCTTHEEAFKKVFESQTATASVDELFEVGMYGCDYFRLLIKHNVPCGYKLMKDKDTVEAVVTVEDGKLMVTDGKSRLAPDNVYEILRSRLATLGMIVYLEDARNELACIMVLCLFLGAEKHPVWYGATVEKLNTLTVMLNYPELRHFVISMLSCFSITTIRLPPMQLIIRIMHQIHRILSLDIEAKKADDEFFEDMLSLSWSSTRKLLTINTANNNFSVTITDKGATWRDQELSLTELVFLTAGIMRLIKNDYPAEYSSFLPILKKCILAKCPDFDFGAVESYAKDRHLWVEQSPRFSIVRTSVKTKDDERRESRFSSQQHQSSSISYTHVQTFSQQETAKYSSVVSSTCKSRFDFRSHANKLQELIANGDVPADYALTSTETSSLGKLETKISLLNTTSEALRLLLADYEGKTELILFRDADFDRLQIQRSKGDMLELHLVRYQNGLAQFYLGFITDVVVNGTSTKIIKLRLADSREALNEQSYTSDINDMINHVQQCTSIEDVLSEVQGIFYLWIGYTQICSQPDVSLLFVLRKYLLEHATMSGRTALINFILDLFCYMLINVENANDRGLINECLGYMVETCRGYASFSEASAKYALTISITGIPSVTEDSDKTTQVVRVQDELRYSLGKLLFNKAELDVRQYRWLARKLLSTYFYDNHNLLKSSMDDLKAYLRASLYILFLCLERLRSKNAQILFEYEVENLRAFLQERADKFELIKSTEMNDFLVNLEGILNEASASPSQFLVHWGKMTICATLVAQTAMSEMLSFDMASLTDFTSIKSKLRNNRARKAKADAEYKQAMAEHEVTVQKVQTSIQENDSRHTERMGIITRLRQEMESKEREYQASCSEYLRRKTDYELRLIQYQKQLFDVEKCEAELKSAQADFQLALIKEATLKDQLLADRAKLEAEVESYSKKQVELETKRKQVMENTKKVEEVQREIMRVRLQYQETKEANLMKSLEIREKELAEKQALLESQNQNLQQQVVNLEIDTSNLQKTHEQREADRVRQQQLKAEHEARMIVLQTARTEAASLLQEFQTDLDELQRSLDEAENAMNSRSSDLTTLEARLKTEQQELDKQKREAESIKSSEQVKLFLETLSQQPQTLSTALRLRDVNLPDDTDYYSVIMSLEGAHVSRIFQVSEQHVKVSAAVGDAMLTEDQTEQLYRQYHQSVTTCTMSPDGTIRAAFLFLLFHFACSEQVRPMIRHDFEKLHDGQLYDKKTLDKFVEFTSTKGSLKTAVKDWSTYLSHLAVYGCVVQTVHRKAVATMPDTTWRFEVTVSNTHFTLYVDMSDKKLVVFDTPASVGFSLFMLRHLAHEIEAKCRRGEAHLITKEAVTFILLTLIMSENKGLAKEMGTFQKLFPALQADYTLYQREFLQCHGNKKSMKLFIDKVNVTVHSNTLQMNNSSVPESPPSRILVPNINLKHKTVLFFLTSPTGAKRIVFVETASKITAHWDGENGTQVRKDDVMDLMRSCHHALSLCLRNPLASSGEMTLFLLLSFAAETLDEDVSDMVKSFLEELEKVSVASNPAYFCEQARLSGADGVVEQLAGYHKRISDYLKSDGAFIGFDVNPTAINNFAYKKADAYCFRIPSADGFRDFAFSTADQRCSCEGVTLTYDGLLKEVQFSTLRYLRISEASLSYVEMAHEAFFLTCILRSIHQHSGVTKIKQNLKDIVFVLFRHVSSLLDNVAVRNFALGLICIPLRIIGKVDSLGSLTLHQVEALMQQLLLENGLRTAEARSLPFCALNEPKTSLAYFLVGNRTFKTMLRRPTTITSVGKDMGESPCVTDSVKAEVASRMINMKFHKMAIIHFLLVLFLLGDSGELLRKFEGLAKQGAKPEEQRIADQLIQIYRRNVLSSTTSVDVAIMFENLFSELRCA